MTTRRNTLDMLGETHLPEDLFTDTSGLNGLTDTFPDIGYGLGVLEGDVLQESPLPPNLPDGLVAKQEFSFDGVDDITDFMREASLADLSWLEVSEQDASRLPDNPVDNGIRELEDAWGVDRRTDGLSIVPNKDREASVYQASLDQPKPRERALHGIQSALQRAARQMAAGMSCDAATRQIVAHFGSDIVKQLREDEGLLGRVFIRASDYPGCANGDWTPLVRKKSSEAAYVVQKSACSGCVYAQSGKCDVFKKKLVASVPWREAAQMYEPLLVASGRPLPKNQPPKTALRTAFTMPAQGMPHVRDMRPVHADPARSVSLQDARQTIAVAPSVQELSNLTRVTAVAKIAQWVSAGLLSRVQGDAIAASNSNPSDMIRTAVRAINTVSEGVYSGGINAGKMGYAASAQTAAKELLDAKRLAVEANQRIDDEHIRRVEATSRTHKRIVAIEQRVDAISKQIDLGLRGRALVAHIWRTFDAADRGLALELLDPVVRAKDALVGPRSAVASYSGLTNDVSVSSIDAQTAWKHLRDVHLPSAIDLEDRRRIQARQKLTAMFSRWVRSGVLSEADALRLLSSTASESDVLRVAASIIKRVRSSSYSGVENDARVAAASIQDVWKQLRIAEEAQRKKTEGIAAVVAQRTHELSRAGKRDAGIRAKAASIIAQIERGLRGKPLLNTIRNTIAKDELRDAAKYLDPVIQRLRALDDETRVGNTYAGPAYQQAPLNAPMSVGPAYGEVDRLLRWAKRQMSEGLAGRDLTDLLQVRFAGGVRTAASSALQALRASHEGLAGHLYVDASAYSSETGIAGCEKGALRHRANTIPAVLQISRCKTCTARVAKEDGTPVCRIYNKTLVASAPTPDPVAYQAEMIRLADGTDADRTAALFSNTFDPDEFQLSGGELDQIRLADLPPARELEDIFFGGMEIG